ncbi:flagellin protein FlaC [Vibrio astriarenae]|nr:flagellin protein FlaC [Vibrio sp. C7]
MNKEFNQLKASIDRIAETTSFGGTRLLNGDFKEVSFQIGAASGQAVSMSLDTVETNAKPMGGRLIVSKNIISHLSDGVSGPLSMSFAADKSKQHAINLSLSSSDNLEQIATQINGQSDLLSASVTHNGELQIFVPYERNRANWRTIL